MQVLSQHQVLNGFYAVYNHVQMKIQRNGQNCSRNFCVLPVADAADEGTVNLQGVKRKTVQVTQRGIPSAEVIDGQADAERLDLLQHLNRRGGIAHDSTFCEFQLQGLRRQLEFAQ